MNGEEKKAHEKRSDRSAQKRGIIIAFAIMVGIVVIWYASGPVADMISSAIESVRANNKGDPTSDYMDHISTYIFAPSNYNEDIYADEEYMQLDRMIYYKEGADTFGVPEDSYAAYGAGLVFFGRYFDDVIHGRYEDYDAYFTEEYFKNQSNKERFTPQKLYDILVEHIRTELKDDGSHSHIYYVSFKIFKNTGTFRNDIGSDMSRTVVYELIEDTSGNVLINDIGR